MSYQLGARQAAVEELPRCAAALMVELSQAGVKVHERDDLMRGLEALVLAYAMRVIARIEA